MSQKVTSGDFYKKVPTIMEEEMKDFIHAYSLGPKSQIFMGEIFNKKGANRPINKLF